MAIFTGAGVAIVTPFHTDGTVNFEKFAEMIEYQILNKSEYNRNAMLLNLMKWSAITGMVVIAGCLILVRKKRS